MESDLVKATSEQTAAPETLTHDRPQEPVLSEEFWRTLAEQPRCKVDGVCDGCGRCEH